jgi:hypothetical protein
MPFLIAAIGGLVALLFLRERKHHQPPPDTGQSAPPTFFGLRSPVGQSMPDGSCPPGTQPMPGGCSHSGFADPGYATDMFQVAPPRGSGYTVPPNQAPPQLGQLGGVAKGSFGNPTGMLLR